MESPQEGLSFWYSRRLKKDSIFYFILVILSFLFPRYQWHRVCPPARVKKAVCYDVF